MSCGPGGCSGARPSAGGAYGSGNGGVAAIKKLLKMAQKNPEVAQALQKFMSEQGGSGSTQQAKASSSKRSSPFAASSLA